MYALPHAGGVVRKDSHYSDGPPRVDLRSDTVTLPTPAVRADIARHRAKDSLPLAPQMRAAMATAVCGDDVMDDDVTVKALEQKARARVLSPLHVVS